MSAQKSIALESLQHAGGLLLQTLPAYTLGCDIKLATFNPFTFLKDFQNQLNKVNSLTSALMLPMALYPPASANGSEQYDVVLR